MIEEAHKQRHRKVNEGAGSIYNRILRPYFEENLTAEHCIEFSRLELVPALIVIFPNEADPMFPLKPFGFNKTALPHTLANRTEV